MNAKGYLRPIFVWVFVLLLFAFHDFLLRNSCNTGIRQSGILAWLEVPGPTKQSSKMLRNTALPADSVKSVRFSNTAQASNDTSGILQDYADSASALVNFFRTVKTHKRKIRIAYFGDSMIEGDLLTQDLRRLFQEWLGGSGVGFVPLTSPVSGFRQTIRHQFSDNWQHNDISEKFSRQKFSPGPGGYSHFTSASEAWVELAAGSAAINDPVTVTLWYGKQQKPLNLVFDNARKLTNYSLKDTLAFSVCTLTNAWNGKRMRITLSPESGPLYGLSCESDSGVVLDNFAFRGNSGIALAKVPFRLWQAAAQKLQYDLVVLHYGLNVASETSRDYHWYNKGMSHVLSLFKRAFPGVPLLLVGVSDKGYRDPEGQLATIPGVFSLDSLQQQMAVKQKTAFYSLFRAMGGPGSMVSWVNRPYPLANKDFTHVNAAGGRTLAKLIFTDIKKEYDAWAKK